MSETVVKGTGVQKSFGRRSVLAGADFEVRSGECVAIVGENGTGKTTLLNLIAGFLRPDGGSLEVSGTVGVCPQAPGLVELLTAQDHLRLVAKGRSSGQAYDRCRSLLHRLGFEDSMGVPAKALSGGQRQKLNLALSVANDPQLLLLDEPYQGFDYGTYIDFWQQLDDWRAEGRTLVVVTHLLAEQQRVDRVLRISGGRMEESG